MKHTNNYVLHYPTEEGATTSVARMQGYGPYWDPKTETWVLVVYGATATAMAAGDPEDVGPVKRYRIRRALSKAGVR